MQLFIRPCRQLGHFAIGLLYSHQRLLCDGLDALAASVYSIWNIIMLNQKRLILWV